MTEQPCSAYEPGKKDVQRPPCPKLKHFLVTGDALCTWDLYWCPDCERVWSFADCGFDGTGPTWALEPFSMLEDPSYWRHGVIDNSYPRQAFTDGKRSFGKWVAGLTEPEYAVGPV